MRIAPLYYLTILAGFVGLWTGLRATPEWMAFYDVEADSYNLLMHLTFLSAWDARVTASIIGVEWTIPVEIFWYIVLPALLPVPLLLRQRAMVFAGLVLLAVLAKAADHFFLPKHAAHFMPISHGIYFYMGVIAEVARGRAQSGPESRRTRLTWAAIGLFVVGLVTDLGVNSLLLGIATAMLITFRASSRDVRGVLCLRPMLFLGSISYSIYLLHPLAIETVLAIPALAAIGGFGHFALVALLTIAASVVTYSAIEHPSNSLGKRLFSGKA